MPRRRKSGHKQSPTSNRRDEDVRASSFITRLLVSSVSSPNASEALFGYKRAADVGTRALSPESMLSRTWSLPAITFDLLAMARKIEETAALLVRVTAACCRHDDEDDRDDDEDDSDGGGASAAQPVCACPMEDAGLG